MNTRCEIFSTRHSWVMKKRRSSNFTLFCTSCIMYYSRAEFFKFMYYRYLYFTASTALYIQCIFLSSFLLPTCFIDFLFIFHSNPMTYYEYIVFTFLVPICIVFTCGAYCFFFVLNCGMYTVLFFYILYTFLARLFLWHVLHLSCSFTYIAIF